MGVEQLAQELRVSVTPIRHALARLERDGLVTKEPYKGYLAADLLDKQSMTEIFQIRLMIEPELAARAAAAATKQDIDFLAQAAKKDPFEELPPSPDEPQEESLAISWDVALHRRVATVAAIKTMATILEQFNRRVSPYRSYWNGVDEGRLHSGQDRQATKREHAAIVQAIRAGDSEAARLAMVVHLTAAANRSTDVFVIDSTP